MSFALKTFILIAMLTIAGGAAQAVQVVAQVDQRDIYVGEKFSYHIIIDGDNKPGQVDLAPLAAYSPQSAGNQDISQSMISIVNGQTTQNVTKRFVMSWQLLINKQGRAVLPSVTVTVDGQTFETNQVEVNILAPGTSDQLDLDVSLSDSQCYVGQPVIMTVKFYISGQIGDCQFNIPAFDGNDFVLEDPDIFNRQVKEYDIGNGVHVFVSQERVVHNGRDSTLISFSKALLPRQSGDITLSPCSVSANLAVGRQSDDVFGNFFSNRQYKRFMVNSKPLALNVLPLPENDKPAAFYGLIGNYSIEASANPTSVSVGEPITLTIKIGGGRYLKAVKWPELDKVTGLSADFQIPTERSSPTVENGCKIFTQTIRASNDKVTEIPPIPLACFDPGKGKYVTIATAAIPLKVSPTKLLTPADLQGRDAAASSQVEAVKTGLSANYEDLDALENQSLSPVQILTSPISLILWALPLTLLVVSGGARAFLYTSPQRMQLKRKRMARQAAVTRLKHLGTSGDSKNVAEAAAAMKQYLGERFGRTAGSLTADDCRAIIVDATGDAQLAGEFGDIVAKCEAATYAPLEIAIDRKIIESIIELINKIEKRAAR
jgi:hypothetical protein